MTIFEKGLTGVTIVTCFRFARKDKDKMLKSGNDLIEIRDFSNFKWVYKFLVTPFEDKVSCLRYQS